MLAELLADFAEREPGRGEIRRQLDRLLQQVGGGGEIALQLQVAREIIAAVGNEIAGGQEQAADICEGTRCVVAGLRPKDGCAGQARASRLNIASAAPI